MSRSRLQPFILASLFILANASSVQSTVLFEKRTFSSTQKSVEAVFHVSVHPGGQAELAARWVAQDSRPLRLLTYKIVGPKGQIIKEGLSASAGVATDFPFGLDLKSHAQHTRAADTNDWSTKNHSYVEEHKGIGWSIPVGKSPEPSEKGSNTEASAAAAVIQSIAFSIPRQDDTLKGYNLECVMDRGGQEPVVLVYPLWQ